MCKSLIFFLILTLQFYFSHKGDLPLHHAIRRTASSNNALITKHEFNCIKNKFPKAVRIQELHSGGFPFMIAASLSLVETTFDLLRFSPDVIMRAA